MNLVQEHEASYIDLFDRKNLVYLSRDAEMTLDRFDPEKIYILGNIIDDDSGRFEYSTVSQARLDGVACKRLPVERLYE